MSTETESFVDPRENVTHPLETGQMYEDSRTSDELVLVYLSEDVALLRDEQDERHRLESRKQFEENVGSERYSLQSNADGSATTSAKLSKLNRLLEQYENENGRKASHKATAIEEAIEMVEENGAPDANETVDFESVSGIGAKTASSLVAAGYTVRKDIRNASDEELLAIDGMGAGNLENLREHVA